MSEQRYLDKKQLTVLMTVKEICEYMDKNPGTLKAGMAEAVDTILEGEDTPVKGIVVIDVLNELYNEGYIKCKDNDYYISEAGMVCLEGIERSLKDNPEVEQVTVPVNVENIKNKIEITININAEELGRIVSYVAGLIGGMFKKK